RAERMRNCNYLLLKAYHSEAILATLLPEISSLFRETQQLLSYLRVTKAYIIESASSGIQRSRGAGGLVWCLVLAKVLEHWICGEVRAATVGDSYTEEPDHQRHQHSSATNTYLGDYCGPD